MEHGKEVNPRILELQAAEEIFAEIFHIKTEDIEDMVLWNHIQRNFAGICCLQETNAFVL